MAKMSVWDKIAISLLIAGGLNWGLVAMGYNFVNWLASITAGWVSTLVYSLVGLSAVYSIYKFFK